MGPPPKKRSWIWFFAIVGTLTVAGVLLEIWFNLRQQLDSTQLERARALWEDRGPADYEMEYTVREGSDATLYKVQVKGKKPAAAWVSENGKWKPTESPPYGTMDAIFDRIAANLEADAKPGSPRVFATASFSRNDGHVVRYVRSVSSRRERLEIDVHRFGNPEQAGTGR
jgi:hypothetical protein